MPHSAVPPSSQRRATNLVWTRSGSVKVKARAPLPRPIRSRMRGEHGFGGSVDSECVLSAECQTSHDLILVAWKLRSWWTRCGGHARSSQAGRGSTSQEPTTEHWWADVLADPRARIRRQPGGLYCRDSKRTAQKSCYRLANEPSPVIEVACSKCEWTAAFSRAELLAMYGAECPLPPCSIIWRCLVAPKFTPTGIGAASNMSTQSKGGTVAGKHASA
jgi:hypothetical protein